MKSHLCECNLFVVVAATTVIVVAIVAIAIVLFFKIFCYRQFWPFPLPHSSFRFEFLFYVMFVCICTKQSFWFFRLSIWLWLPFIYRGFWLGLTCGWVYMLWVLLCFCFCFHLKKGASFSSLLWLSYMAKHGNLQNVNNLF